MSGGVIFSKVDLSHACLQVRLDETAKKYLVINTHKVHYEYNRLPFGVSSAPAIFQRTMQNLLQGLEHVAVYIDDILITGCTEEEHVKTLDEVLTRLERAGMQLKKSKCLFLLPSIEYLGHKISKELQPTDEKVRAISDALRPTNRSQLKAFLGLINYYSKFIPNMSTILSRPISCCRQMYHRVGRRNKMMSSYELSHFHSRLIYLFIMTVQNH